MKKRVLSLLLSMSLCLSLLPTNAFAAGDEPAQKPYVAQNNTTKIEYELLDAAIDAASSSDTIKLLSAYGDAYPNAWVTELSSSSAASAPVGLVGAKSFHAYKPNSDELTALAAIQNNNYPAILQNDLAHTITAYSTWPANFEISFDKAIGANDVMICGQYATYPWLEYAMPAQEAGNSFELMPVVLATLKQPTEAVTLSEIIQFNCGVKNLKPANNSGKTVTVDLYICSPTDSSIKILLAEAEYVFPTMNVVAQIGNNKYETLQAAVDAAQDGDTVTLLADVAATGAVVVANKKITLNLGTNKITSTGSGLTATGTADVTVNATTGGIIADSDNDSAIDNSTDGPKCIHAKDSASITVTGGSYSVGAKENDANSTVYNEGTGTISITGGTFESTGLYNNKKYVLNTKNGTSGVITVSGGTFVAFNPAGGDDSGNPNNYVADGYESVQSGDNWVVSAKNYVAQIGSTNYETLSAAIAAAQDGDTVTLLADCSEQITAALSNSITIDGGSHKMTGKLWLTGNVSNSVTVQNFKFETYGLDLKNFDKVVVKDNAFKDITMPTSLTGVSYEDAILVNASKNVTISGNTIDGAQEVGINCRDIRGALSITGNTVKNTWHNSVQIVWSDDNHPIKPTTSTITNNTFENWGSNVLPGKSACEGRALRARVNNLTFTGNVMLHTNAPEQYVKLSDVTGTLDLSANYWGGNNPTQNSPDIYLNVNGPADESAALKSYYTDAAKQQLVTLSESVAQIGNAKYATLADAIAHVDSNASATIKLLRDVTLTDTLMVNKALTIDGQGTYRIIADTNFTAAKVISGSESCDLTLKNVTVNADGKCRVIVISGGKLTIDGATITGGNAGSSYIGGIYMTGKSTFIMNSGSITGNTSAYTNKTSSDAKYYLKYADDLWIGSEATGTINGGTVGSIYANSNEYAQPNHGLTMTNGEVTNVFVEWDGSKAAAVFHKNGGTVSNLTIANDNCNPHEVAFEVISNPDNGTFTPAAAAAKIGDKQYSTLSAAIAAAASGDTVTLLADCSEQITATVSKSITIDGNNKNMTGKLWLTGSGSNSVTVQNFKFETYGLDLKNFDKVVVKDNAFKDITMPTSLTGVSYEDAIFVNASKDITISGNTIDGAQEVGINCRDIGGELSITGNTVKNTWHNSIQIVWSNNNSPVRPASATVSGNILQNWGSHALPGKSACEGRALRARVNNLTFTGNVMIPGNTVPEEYVKLSDVTGTLDLSANYWGGNNPTQDEPDIYLNAGSSADESAALKSYYTTYTNSTLGGLVDLATSAAKIGNAKYATLADAIAHVDSNASATIELLRDVTLSSTLTISKNITIDGQNQYTIKATDDTFTNVGDKTAMVRVTNNADVTLKNATLNGNNKTRVIVADSGTLTIDGATITGGNAGSSYIGGVYMTGKSTFIMNSGTIIGNTSAYTSKTSFDAKSYLKYADDLWIGSEAVGTISGGTVDSIYANSNEYSVPNHGLTMTGGTATNVFVEWDGTEVAAVFNKSGGTVTNLLIPTDNCYPHEAALQTISNPANGIFTHVAAAAKIGNKQYSTLAAAIAAAQDNQTVMLLADCSEQIEATLSNSITIDGNNKNMTGKLWLTGSGSNSVTVQNFKFAAYGLDIKGFDAVTVSSNSFSNIKEKNSIPGVSYEDAILVNASKDVTISGNTIDGAQEVGINCRDISGALSITGNTVKNTWHNAIQIVWSNNNSPVRPASATVSGNILQNWGSHALPGKSACEGRALRARVNNLTFTGNVMIPGNTVPEEYVKLSDVTGTLDLSANYWGGNNPTKSGIYLNTTAGANALSELVSYYTTCDDTTPSGLVTLSDSVAKISGTYYKTLGEAISAAQSGDTIKLLGQANITSDTTIPENVTLKVVENGKLTVDSGKLSVNGTLDLSEYSAFVQEAPCSSETSALVLNAGAEIEFNSTSTLKCAKWHAEICALGTITFHAGAKDYTQPDILQVGGENDAISSNSNSAYIRLKSGKIVQTPHSNSNVAEGYDYKFVNAEVTYLAFCTMNSDTMVIDGNSKVNNVALFVGNSGGSITAEEGAQFKNALDASVTLPNGKKCTVSGAADYPYKAATAVASVEKNAAVTYYASLDTAVSCAADNDTVMLLENVTQNTRLAVTKKITLDLNGKTISNTVDIWHNPGIVSLISVGAGGDLTITGNGFILAKENDCYAIDTAAATAKLTIENGTIRGNLVAVYAFDGTISIHGGTFDLSQKTSGDPYRYLLNCKDDKYKAGTAKIEVSGGTFVGYNPAQSSSESPTAIFVVDGYKSVHSGSSWVVKPGYDVTLISTSNGGAAVNMTFAAAGETIVVDTTPATDYELDKITYKVGDDTYTLPGNSFVMPAAAVTVEATFKKILYAVTIGSHTNGTLTADKESAARGDTVTVTAMPDADYKLTALTYTVGNDTYDVVGDSFVMPAQNVTVAATFTAKNYVAEMTHDSIAVKYESFDEALDAAVAGDSLKLLANVTVSGMISLTKSITLDLNGKTLSAATNTAKLVEVSNNATLTINGTTADSAVVGRINVGKQVNHVGDDGNVVINGGSYSVGDGQTVLHVNGDCKNSNVTISGATIVSPTDNAIQFNGKGTFEIANSSVTGATAVYVKSGTLTITASNIHATGAKQDYAFNSDGANATGDAIVADACEYPGNLPSVHVVSGTVTSDHAAPIAYYQYDGDGDGEVEDSAVITKEIGVDIAAPEGYFWENNTTLAKKIASITSGSNTAYYASIAKAMAAAAEGQTIQLVVDTAEAAENTNGVSFTLDLNGKIWTSDATATLKNNGGTITICDLSSGHTGKIKNTANTVDKGITVLVRTGSVVIESGSFENASQYEATISVGTSAPTEAEIAIHGGTFQNTAAGAYAYNAALAPLTLDVYNALNDTTRISITGGKFYGNDPSLGDDVIGGSFVHDDYESKNKGDFYEVELRPAAKIDNIEYAQLSTAILACANTQKTIKLQRAVSENVTIAKGASVVLDLNGKALTAANNNNSPVITNNGNLLIQNSSTSAAGTLSGTVLSLGSISVSGGFFDGTIRVISHSDTVGSARITGGTIRAEIFVEQDKGFRSETNPTLIITGGSFTNTIKVGERGSSFTVNEALGTVKISGGTFSVRPTDANILSGYMVVEGENVYTVEKNIEQKSPVEVEEPTDISVIGSDSQTVSQEVLNKVKNLVTDNTAVSTFVDTGLDAVYTQSADTIRTALMTATTAEYPQSEYTVTIDTSVNRYLQIKLTQAVVDTTSAENTVYKMSFDVKPMAVVTVTATKDSMETSDIVTTVIPNIAIKSPVTFRLPVDSSVKVGTKAVVYHTETDTTTEYGVYAVREENGDKFIEISARSFSIYSYELKPDVIIDTNDIKLSASISLAESTRINFIVKLPTTCNPNQYQVKTAFETGLIEGGTEKIIYETIDLNDPDLITVTQENGYNIYKMVVAKVYSFQMTCPVHIQVLCDGVEIKSLDYSIQKYCQNMIAQYQGAAADTKEGKLVALCKATLDYGGNAQRIFSGRSYDGGEYATWSEGQYANSDRNPGNTITADKPLLAACPSEHQLNSLSKVMNTSGITYSMVLGAETTIRVQIPTKSGFNSAAATLAYQKGHYDAQLGEIVYDSTEYTEGISLTRIGTTNKYYIRLEGIKPSELLLDYRIFLRESVSGKTVQSAFKYSPATYAYKRWTVGESGGIEVNQVTSDFAHSLVAFGTAASEYFTTPN